MWGDHCIHKAQGFLIVYSVTSPSSFHEVSKFRDRILRVKDAATVPIVIVGNKARVRCCRLLAAALSSGTAQRVARPRKCTW
jgi:GTPase SAR1 family protein